MKKLIFPALFWSAVLACLDVAAGAFTPARPPDGPVSRAFTIPLDYANTGWGSIAIQAVPFLPSHVEARYTLVTGWRLGGENTNFDHGATMYFGDGPLSDFDVRLKSGVEMRLDPPAAPFFSQAVELPLVAMALEPFDLAVDFAGSSGFTTPWMRASKRSSVEVAPLAGFAGFGTIPVNFRRLNQWAVSIDSGTGAYSIANLVALEVELVFFP